MPEPLLRAVEWLQFGGSATPAWLWLVRCAALYLLGLGVSVFQQRELALRFLGGFAATTRANSLESVLRFAAGVAFIGASPQMRAPALFAVFGAVLAVTAIPMLLLPGVHKHYAAWAVPFAQRIAPLFGALALMLGALILFATLG